VISQVQSVRFESFELFSGADVPIEPSGSWRAPMGQQIISKSLDQFVQRCFPNRFRTMSSTRTPNTSLVLGAVEDLKPLPAAGALGEPAQEIDRQFQAACGTLNGYVRHSLGVHLPSTCGSIPSLPAHRGPAQDDEPATVFPSVNIRYASIESP